MVKLVLSSIYSERLRWEVCRKKLEEQFGAVDYQGSENSFSHTDYYCREMGSPLARQFLSFERLSNPVDLVQIKLFTNSLEKEVAHEGNRRVNLDPGHLSLGQFVLATGKPAPHRIYLDQGIYAELTLIYEQGSFRALPWTYPDYASPEMIALLNKLREELKASLHAGREGR
jgi:hypothetical protein